MLFPTLYSDIVRSWQIHYEKFGTFFVPHRRHQKLRDKVVGFC